jgi:UPF0755 protein
MKKKIIIALVVIFLFFALVGICGYSYYNSSIGAMDKNDTSEIVFEIKPGTPTKKIMEELCNRGLTKNKDIAYYYAKKYPNLNPQAGVYSLNKAMSLKDILDKFNKGDIIDDSIAVTFVEGKRITDYAKVINKNFGYSEEEVIATLADRAYLEELIEKYWFLTDDILNDKLYYALEGYLYPDTYAFKKDASIKDVVEKMLSGMSNKLANARKEIDDSEYNVHQILTLASIVELEGGNSNDRQGVAGVFANRLKYGWSLGSDVTTYYGARINMADRDLYQAEIEEVNGYNTRPAAMAGKLPIGPICSPSYESIRAAIEPAEHDYMYFVADKNGKTYFNRTYDEHQKTLNKVKSAG